MSEVKLHLSHNQVLKAKRGHPVQLKAEQIGVGHPFMLHPETYRRVVSAKRRGKGVRLHLSEAELEGAGLKETLQKVGKFYQEHVKPVAAPYLRKGAKRLLSMGKTALDSATMGAFAPELESLYQRYGDKAIDALGRISGAYGMHMQGGRLVIIPSPSYSPILSETNPAKHVASSQLPPPGEPNPNFEMAHPKRKTKKMLAGSFRAI